MTDPEEPGAEATDPRLQAGLEHLQRAAHEVIAASRALLDAAEDVVDDPRAARTLIDLFGSVATRARRGPPHRDDDNPPVQRIPVS